MFPFLLHWSAQPCESTHISTSLKKGYFVLKPGFSSCFNLYPHPVGGWVSQRWGRPDCSFPETRFKSQGDTSARLIMGKALGFDAKLSCLNKREQKYSGAMLANGVGLEGLRPTSFVCGSACLTAPEIHLSNPRKCSPWKSARFHHKM